MAREKSPGLKILWVWTLGTAAILVTSVVRTRLRDMEQLINAEQQQQQEQRILGDSVVIDDSPETPKAFSPEVKS